MSTLNYLKNFIKDPNVASVTPTSRFTINRVCKYIDFQSDIRIIEYGPADGVFTRVLLDKMTPRSQIIAIETNRHFAQSLGNLKDDRLTVVNSSAEEVRDIMEKMKWEYADYVLSGIPFSFLKKEARHRILKDSAALLSEHGGFLGYQTSSHLKPFLSEHFKKVETEMEYLNIPPMCIYIAKNDTETGGVG